MPPPPPLPVLPVIPISKSKTKAKKPWRPVITAKCCSIEDQTTRRSVILRSFSRPCRPNRAQFSKTVAELPSFRRLSFSDLSTVSTCSSTRINNNSDDHRAFGGSLHVFQLTELRAITQDFSSNFLLGQGGFGTVHKGYMDENFVQGLKAQAVAVKLLDIQGLQGHREWLAEVIFLGQLRHPHLVKLIGYGCENEERLLVYEFMPRGSLENHLFKRISVPLAWGTRLKIAIGAAKGLAFLHGGADQPVIYRDFKTSNILLDSDFTAKLSDFGLAKMGPEGSDTHVTTRVMGTYGYAAPEYVNTGHLTIKSDVYSFGVVLLELLTGRRSVDKTKPKSEQNLVDWVRPYLSSSRRLRCVMDPKLGGQYSVKGARGMASLALQCVSLNTKSRPKMPYVIEFLEGLQNLRDMALTTCGQRSVMPKSVRTNGANIKGKREIRQGAYQKPSTNSLSRYI